MSANKVVELTTFDTRKGTRLTTPQPPRGADWVGEFDDMDARVVFSARFGAGQLSAKAACCRARSGAILDEDGDESVAVILGVEPTIRLTPQQARHFGRNLLSAAAVADDWRLDSALAREGTKQRHAGAHDW